jgi:DNA-binding LytR/AlgR family response regulator
MSYPCLVIDDEALARKVLLHYISKVEELGPVVEFSNAEDALTYLGQHKVPLIFLDIKMQEITGLELAKMLPKDIEVVFTTAYSQHAIDCFDLEALDYLLKPIPYPRFLQAVRRFLDKQKSVGPSNFDWITLKDGSALHKVKLSEISHLEGMKDYVKVHTSDRVYVHHSTMKGMEEKLPSRPFIRVHRSFIVNLDLVRGYYASELDLGKVKVPVGQSYKEQVEGIFKV